VENTRQPGMPLVLRPELATAVRQTRQPGRLLALQGGPMSPSLGGQGRPQPPSHHQCCPPPHPPPLPLVAVRQGPAPAAHPWATFLASQWLMPSPVVLVVLSARRELVQLQAAWHALPLGAAMVLLVWPRGDGMWTWCFFPGGCSVAARFPMTPLHSAPLPKHRPSMSNITKGTLGSDIRMQPARLFTHGASTVKTKHHKWNACQ